MEAPQSFPPLPQHRRSHRGAIALSLIALVLAALVVAALAWARASYGSFAAAWTALSMPHELTSAVFMGEKDDGTAVAYRFERGRYMPVAVPARLTSLAENVAHQAAIERRHGFYELSLDGTAFLDSTSTLAFVSVAPDASTLAVSVSAVPGATTTGAVPEPLILSDSRAWSVVLYDAHHTRPATTLGTGSSPVYIGGMLAWLAPRGIVGMKPGDGITRVLAATSTPLTAPLVASADGAHIAVRDSAAHRILVYGVDAQAAQLIASLPDRSAPSFALGNDAVYLARVNPSAGTEIWKEPFSGGASKVATLPSSLRIMRIILPSP